MEHLDDLARVGLEPSLWRWTGAWPTNQRDLEIWLRQALANAANGTEVPFATVDRATNAAIGSTRFLAIVPQHRRLEIGWTWIAKPWQRSGANREAKLLQLGYAFDVLDANRVEFKAHWRNEPSRRALLGIGATYEGIFRNQMIMPDLSMRHSAYYSVIADEWPLVRARLEAGLYGSTAADGGLG
jgi:RimJ/RimL family protein N-acetyltransferase